MSHYSRSLLEAPPIFISVAPIPQQKRRFTSSWLSRLPLSSSLLARFHQQQCTERDGEQHIQVVAGRMVDLRGPHLLSFSFLSEEACSLLFFFSRPRRLKKPSPPPLKTTETDWDGCISRRRRSGRFPLSSSSFSSLFSDRDLFLPLPPPPFLRQASVDPRAKGATTAIQPKKKENKLLFAKVPLHSFFRCDALLRRRRFRVACAMASLDLKNSFPFPSFCAAAAAAAASGP